MIFLMLKFCSKALQGEKESAAILKESPALLVNIHMD